MAYARPKKVCLGAGRNRTGDARLRTPALCPLSYSPTRLRRLGMLHLCRASEASKASDADTARVRRCRDDRIVNSRGCFHDTLSSTLTACSRTRGSKGAAQAEARYAINPTFVW